MEPASLRIKFTPHVQEYQNDSKCCLEIVPEVTCIQNLESIDWYQQSDIIEYTVPMTYKVILRKRPGEKESHHDLDKVYHSCVDLLPASSFISLSCSNFMRIISDTMISHNFRATVLSTEIRFGKDSPTELNPVIVSNNFKDEQVDADVTIGKLLNEISNDDFYMTNDAHDVDCSVSKVDASTSQLFTKDVDNAVNDGVYKAACTSCSKIQLYKESKSELKEKVTEISAGISNENSRNSLRKLSVTPIYSINTIKNEVDQNTPFISPYDTMTTFFKPADIISETVKIRVLHDDYDDKKTNKEVLNSTDYCIIPNRFRGYKRELPEVRVANFMKKMETEIMPLKIMLHDILQKCASMGLTINKSFRLKEHPITNKQFIKYRTSEKLAKCNRVVYSIVFDG